MADIYTNTLQAAVEATGDKISVTFKTNGVKVSLYHCSALRMANKVPNGEYGTILSNTRTNLHDHQV
jgi:hypothetical protein